MRLKKLLAGLLCLALTGCGNSTASSTPETDAAGTEETDMEDPTINDGTWIHIDEDDHEGIILTTEFNRTIGWGQPNNQPPTVEEVQEFESQIRREITESGTNTVFSNLLDGLPEYKRYYYTETLVSGDRDAPRPDVQLEKIAPSARPDLDGERVIVVLFSDLREDDWKKRFSNNLADGVTDEHFYALYLPDANIFWLQFSIDSSIDGTYH